MSCCSFLHLIHCCFSKVLSFVFFFFCFFLLEVFFGGGHMVLLNLNNS